MERKPKILIIGANGQLGTELAFELAQRYGNMNVITSDKAPIGRHLHIRHLTLDVTDTSVE